MLVLYVDVIMLAENNKGMLHDVKQYLSKTFEMKDMGETSYVIGIEIFLDRSQGLLSLSQKGHISKILDIYIKQNNAAQEQLQFRRKISFVKCNVLKMNWSVKKQK